MLTGLVRCLCGAKLGYQGGVTKPLRLQCRNKARPGQGYGCPHKRRLAAHYEALVAAAIVALPPPRVWRTVATPVDPAIWQQLESERRGIAWRHKHRLLTDAEALAELAELDGRRAAVPQGDAAARELAAELTDVLPHFAALDPPTQNDLLRHLIEEVGIAGEGVAIAWRPLALALFPVPESG